MQAPAKKRVGGKSSGGLAEKYKYYIFLFLSLFCTVHKIIIIIIRD